jgi:hypothetical protein
MLQQGDVYFPGDNGGITRHRLSATWPLEVFSTLLAVSLSKSGCINEYRIMVNPVVLGSGKSLFKGKQEKLTPKLLKTMTFGSGVVKLYYAPGT